MANTVWKGQLTFGLVSFPVRLVRAARKERIPLRYVQEIPEDGPGTSSPLAHSPGSAQPAPDENEEQQDHEPSADVVVAQVRQAYIPADDTEPVPSRELQRGYEVAPGQFAVVRSEDLRRLRQPTSSEMPILRSVRMNEIDPVFLETSYYVLPGTGGEHSYGLFYRALKDSGYAALAEVGMHGRQHVIVIRAGAKGLIAHTMYYVNEVRGSEEHSVEAKDLSAKELALAKRFVEAIAAPFRPEEFTDRYREQLESLIASRKPVPTRGAPGAAAPTAGKVIDILEALRKSLERVAAEKTARKPAAAAQASTKPRKRRA